MNRQFLPYYISRAALSLAFSFLVFGISIKGAAFSALFFAGFLIYLHSGWFQVDTNQPFFPLRRDARGCEVQRKALIAALLAGVGSYVVLSVIPLNASVLSLPLTLGILAYFGVQFLLFLIA